MNTKHLKSLIDEQEKIIKLLSIIKEQNIKTVNLETDKGILYISPNYIQGNKLSDTDMLVNSGFGKFIINILELKLFSIQLDIINEAKNVSNTSISNIEDFIKKLNIINSNSNIITNENTK